MDLSNDEVIINQPQLKNIYHPYSDFKNMEILSYSIEEIFAEKLRTLVERLRPRDLYDVIHLHIDKRWSADRQIVKKTLKKKCEYKNVPIPTMNLIESSSRKKALITDWENMLQHQIANLEPYDYYWKQLPNVFEWLEC